MANVRNNHDGRFSVAGVSIRPGATVAIPGWSEDLATAPERALLDAKKIEVVGEEPKPEEKATKPGKGDKAES